MTLTQQRWHLNFTRNSFYIFFPVDGTVSYLEFMPSPLYVRSKRTCSLASRAPNTSKVNNLNVNYLKTLKTHRGPH